MAALDVHLSAGFELVRDNKESQRDVSKKGEERTVNLPSKMPNLCLS